MACFLRFLILITREPHRHSFSLFSFSRSFVFIFPSSFPPPASAPLPSFCSSPTVLASFIFFQSSLLSFFSFSCLFFVFFCLPRRAPQWQFSISSSFSYFPRVIRLSCSQSSFPATQSRLAWPQLLFHFLSLLWFCDVLPGQKEGTELGILQMWGGKHMGARHGVLIEWIILWSRRGNGSISWVCAIWRRSSVWTLLVRLIIICYPIKVQWKLLKRALTYLVKRKISKTWCGLSSISLQTLDIDILGNTFTSCLSLPIWPCEI